MLRTISCVRLWKRNFFIPEISRCYSVNSDRKRVCIVGSGPAGFYTAQHLLQNDTNVEVDIFEKLPVPFGLIRYGVAPDHPDIKNVINAFTKIALHERCNFYGNVNVGKDVNVAELLDSYNAVVLAFGASCDKVLGIPGENSKNVLPARRIVGWYTGHPDFVNEQIDLDTEVAAIIGHGNVALDVARILLKNLDDLKSTDIAEHAYEALKKSKIRRVVLIGRRGPLQVAFTIKEFREMTKLAGCHVEMLDDNIHKLPIVLEELDRPSKRLVELMNNTFLGKQKTEAPESMKCLELKFCRNPKEILPDANGRVEKLVLTVNDIEGTYSKNSRFKPTDVEDSLECGMVVRSVGYQSVPIDPFVPFDVKKNIIPNDHGKIIGKKGLYCSGWVKTGPIGVILSTMYESFKTGEKLLNDLDKGELPHTLTKTREHVFSLLKNRGVKVVTFKDWQNIDKVEIERGKTKGKSRDVIPSVEEMLAISAS